MISTALEYTGGVPFDLLKPVLERASAEQLFNLEHYNAYLIEDTDVFWEFHCKKEFRNKSREEMETWREMYLVSNAHLGSPSPPSRTALSIFYTVLFEFPVPSFTSFYCRLLIEMPGRA